MNAPAPGTEALATAQLLSLSIRDLRNDPSLAPGGGAFTSVVSAFLPLVYGASLKLVAESPASAANIAAATFECLAVKWRKLPKKTLLAPWLLMAAKSVALRERKRLRLPKAVRDWAPAQYLLLFLRMARLPWRMRAAVVLQHVLQVPIMEGGLALRLDPRRFEKIATKGLARLKRKLTRTPLAADLPVALRELYVPPPEDVATTILDRFSRWTPKAPRSDLTRATLSTWRWLAVRLFFKRVLAGLGAVVCILALLAGTVAYLIHNGYFTEFFMRMGDRQMAKEHPEMLEAARPWPVSEDDFARVQREPPPAAADLYRPTNIWVAKLTFTEEQWDELQPTRIAPVRRLFQDGRIILRNPEAKRSGLSGSLGYEFNWTQAQFEFAGKQFENVGVRYRGNGTFIQSRFGPKQSFKVDLNKFQKKQKIAGVDELNFVNAIPDFSYVRDAMSQFVFRELGVPAPRTAYAYLTIHNAAEGKAKPLGLYCLIENIDKDFAEDRFGTKEVPIFKPVTYDLFVDIGREWNDYAQVYDLKTAATPEQLQRVIEFARVATEASDEEFARRLGEFLDIEELAAFVAGHVLLSSYDGFFTNGQNYYLFLHPVSNKFGFISWDQDHSWGEFGYVGSAESREQASIWEPWVYEFRFLQRVMNVAAFRDAYKGKLEHALGTFFTTERLYSEIDRLAAAIRPAVAAESDFRLERFDQSVSDEWLPGDRNAGPSEGPKAPVHQIKRFIENRIVSVREQLEGRSEGVRLMRGRR